MGFRIQSVTIEGFRGFTKKQTIALQGRHAFCLGSNGNGKSSILEAIRWGLFGSARRRNERVAHRQYTGDCCVEMTLTRSERPWTLKRRLLRGTDGESEPVLTDEHGHRHNLREIIPDFDFQVAGEGMHIIFAPQSARLRKSPEDLSPFEKTVFRHLGLMDPRALLSELSSFIDSQEAVEDDLASEVTGVRTDIDNRTTHLEQQRGAILRAAPWDSETPPTLSESEDRARGLSETIIGKRDSSLEGLSLEALVRRVSDALAVQRAEDPKGLRTRQEQIESLLSQLGELSVIYHEIDKKTTGLENTQVQLQSILEDSSLDQLSAAVDNASRMATRAGLSANIWENTIALLDQLDDVELACPVCETTSSRMELIHSVRDRSRQFAHDASVAELGTLRSRLKEATMLDASIRSLRTGIDELRRRADDQSSRIDLSVVSHAKDLSTLRDVSLAIARLNELKSDVVSHLSDRTGWLSEMDSRLNKLRDEERFQEIQKHLDQLRRLRNRLTVSESEYEKLVAFGGSVRNIRSSTAAQFIELLRDQVPAISTRLSKAFSSLTRHPWYDRLTIDPAKLPKLELRVSSSQDDTKRLELTTVLNGQAEAALSLVPFFAFSDEGQAPIEVYAVLLDDPTRAFDQEHIEVLGARLAELGEHVQLVVASHETARFRDIIPNNFEASSYVLIDCENWSYRDGPKLNVEYGL